MEIGAFFILLIAVIVFVVLGGGVYAIAIRLRQKQLHPEGDKLAADDDDRGRRRPQHRKVESEQRTRFVGSR